MALELPERIIFTDNPIPTLLSAEEGDGEYPEGCSAVSLSTEEIAALDASCAHSDLDAPNIDFTFPVPVPDPEYIPNARP